jgi:hypothetical protein
MKFGGSSHTGPGPREGGSYSERHRETGFGEVGNSAGQRAAPGDLPCR